MPKKPKKAKTGTSWRTLMRRAREAERKGHKAQAAKLRNQAAKLRHGKPTKAPSRSEVGGINRTKDHAWRNPALIDDTANDNGRTLGQRHDRSSYRGMPSAAPGQGEIVGGVDAHLIDELALILRRKGGRDEAQRLLTERLGRERMQGHETAERLQRKLRLDDARRRDDEIVCAFISEVEARQQYRSGLERGSVWTVNALTIVKIVDALNRAGYTARGMRMSEAERQAGADEIRQASERR